MRIEVLEPEDHRLEEVVLIGIIREYAGNVAKKGFEGKIYNIAKLLVFGV